MKTSESIGELAAALAKAQGGMAAVVKDGKNPHLRTTYATLTAVLDAVRPAMSEQGIAIVQSPSVGDGRIVVTTRLLHSSGEWLEDEVAAVVERGKGTTGVQAVGSTITYLRRYALMAFAGVAPEDDDGEGQRGGPATRRREAPDERAARQAQHHPSWEADRARFCAQLGKLGTSYDAVKAHLGASPSTWDQASRARLLADLESGDLVISEAS